MQHKSHQADCQGSTDELVGNVDNNNEGKPSSFISSLAYSSCGPTSLSTRIRQNETDLRRNESTDSGFPVNIPPMALSEFQLNKKRAEQGGTTSAISTADQTPISAPESSADSPREPFKFAGYLAVAVASLFSSTGMLGVKLLPVDNTIQEKSMACMVRGLFMAMFCIISLKRQRKSFAIASGEYFVIGLRAILGALNTFLVFVAVQYITMGECSALKYSSPVWTCMLAFLLLRERVPISLYIALPLSFLGIILLGYPELIIGSKSDTDLDLAAQNYTNQAMIQNASSIDTIDVTHVIPDDAVMAELLQPDEAATSLYAATRWPGILAGLGSSLCISTSIIVLKFRKKTPIDTCSFYMGLATGVVALAIQAVIGFGTIPTTLHELTVHIGIGFSAYACQRSIQWALQFVPAGSYSVVRSLDIVMGFILGAALLHDVILWTSIAGSLVIIVVVTILVLDEYIERLLKPICGCCPAGCFSQRDSNK